MNGVKSNRKFEVLSSYAHLAQGQLERGRYLWQELRGRVTTKGQRFLGTASTLLSENPFIGLCGVADRLPLTSVQMLLCYSQGLFPLDFDGRLRWHCPDPRFVLYLDELRFSPNMRRDIRKSAFSHTFDREPRAILDGCADRPRGTWLSPRLKALYLELFDLGVMHSIETWKDGALVGGSFGLAIGRVFTGETMFHRAPEAGKSSFAHLATHLRERGFLAVDAQFRSDHMERFGAKEIALDEYRKTLALGLMQSASFHPAAESQVTASRLSESRVSELRPIRRSS